MFQEALVIHLGQAISKAILKSWLKEAGFVANLAESSTDIIAKLGIDLSEKRRMERQFHQIADYVADSLLPFFEMEGAKLDDGEKHAVVLALAAGIDSTDVSPLALIKSFDLRSAELSKKILENSEASAKWVSQDGRALLARAAAESARYIVEASARLPEFTPTVFSELLQRQGSLDAITKEVLDELRKLRETARALNPQENMGRFEQRYRFAISHRNDEVELFGLDAPAKIRRQNLSVAYVTLSMNRKRPQRRRHVNVDPDLRIIGVGSRGVAYRMEGGVARIVNIAAHFTDGQETSDSIIASSQFLLIRGDAGSGKTTLLQWLVVNSASQRLSGILAPWNSSLPFLVKLRDYILSEGRAIILIDGIDELDALKRDEVRAWVRGLVKNFPNCRYIVTSRPAAVEDDWLASDGFDEAELLPMSWSDIDNLINHWHAALGAQPSITDTPEALSSIADKLKRQLRGSRALASLATSPLLSAMLCALHFERQQQLPANRIGIYDAAIRMLLDQRDRARGIGTLKLPALSEEQKRAFLQALAYRMLRNGLSTATVPDAVSEVARTLPLVKNVPSDAAAAKIVELLVQRSGIIRSPAEGEIDFVHKTFQEFLAAKAIVDAADLPFLVSQAHNDRWHETVILSAGLAALVDRDQFLKTLIERGDSERGNRQSLYLLAVSCLETAVMLSPEVEQLINHRLHLIIPPRSMRDAKSLSPAGSLAAPLLRRKSSFSAREAAASVRALQLIGGNEAVDALETYGSDGRKTVVRGLVAAWDSFDRVEFARRVLVNSPLEDGFLSLPRLQIPNGLNELKRLTGLSIGDCSDLTNLDAIGALANLTALQLYQVAKVNSVSPLAKLKSLRSLRLGHLSKIESLAPLGTLKELSHLILFDLPVLGDLSFLKYLPNMESIFIQNVPKVDRFTDDVTVTNLRTLRIARMPIYDFSFLSAAGRLTHLECAVPQTAANIQVIGELATLSELDIAISTELEEDMTWLGRLQTITDLELTGYGERQGTAGLSHVAKLERCESLLIKNWQIPDLAQVIPKEVKWLDLDDCTLQDTFPTLIESSRLRTLILSNVKGLKNIDNIQTLRSLISVRISRCDEIEDYSVLRRLPKKVRKYVYDTKRGYINPASL